MLVKAACRSDCFSEAELHDALLRLASDFASIIEEPDESCLTDGPVIKADSKKEDAQQQRENDQGNQQSSRINRNMQVIIDIIATVIEVPVGSIHADTLLRSLGVDSINAIQISAKARQSGLNVPSADIISCQRISDLLRNDTIASNTGPSTSHPPLPPQIVSLAPSQLPDDFLLGKGVEDVFPVSAGMEWLIGMWYLSDGSRFQHIFPFAVQDDIKESQIASAWEALTQSHRILRSSFYCTKDGNLHLAVFKKVPDDRAWTSIEFDSGKESEEVLREFARKLISKPLSPTFPPIKPYLVNHHGKRFFVLHIHHFQYDAWSLRLIIDDMRVLCTQGQVTGCGTVTDLGSFLSKLSYPGHRDEQERYWTSYLTKHFVPSLIPRKEHSSDNTERMIFLQETAKDVQQLRQKARKASLSLNSIFLACWARVQSDYCNKSSATFGLWHHGRNSDSDDSAFSVPIPCMNILPVHVNVDDDPILDLSRQLQRTLAERSVVVQRSHLRDINRWTCDQDSRILLNVYVNILEMDESEGVSPVLQLVHVGNQTMRVVLAIKYYLASLRIPQDHPNANWGLLPRAWETCNM